MKKVYSIVLNPDAHNEVAIERILKFEDYYKIYNHHYLVCTDKSIKEVYEDVVKDMTMLIVLFELTPNLNFWGYFDKALWTWLNDHYNKS